MRVWSTHAHARRMEHADTRRRYLGDARLGEDLVTCEIDEGCKALRGVCEGSPKR